MINITENNPCYGCGVCASACPHNAINLELSQEGFWLPKIDLKKCTKCNICEKVCSFLTPQTNSQTDNEQIHAYSVIYNQPEIRKDSTSGGAGFAIAEHLHKAGYKLVGVKYDNQENITKHFITDSLEEFKQTLNSKYIQSNTKAGFTSIMNGEKYAIFGTPCQIDSLKRWAITKRKANNIILIDLFCHGVPSYWLWKSYLEHHLDSNEKLIKPIFRDKCNGWHTYTLTLKTNKKSHSHTNTHNDIFHNFFLGSYVLNRPCYNCIYRGINSSADIRMGDLWGNKYRKNNQGITGILTFTKRGEQIINNLTSTCTINTELIQTIIEGQIQHKISTPRTRTKIINLLKKGASLRKIYMIYGWKMRIKNLTPKILKTLVKRLIHTS